VLELSEGFIFPNINCEDLHPEVLEYIDQDCVPQDLIERDFKTLIKASFGFGDVNACIVFKKYHDGQ
jgi:3-oxoacyl-(acyl-carrier-protein) synthase